MLDAIIKNYNPDLLKYPDIITNLKLIDTTLPFNLKKSFYHNLKTLKVEIINESVNTDDHFTVAKYNASDNIINININHDLYLFENPPIPNYSEYFYNDIIIHELFHMASTSQINSNTIETGFNCITKEETFAGKYFNEGATEFLANNYYPYGFLKTKYQDTATINAVLCAILGKNNFLNCYFGSDGLANYKKLLSKFTSEKQIDRLFLLVEALPHAYDKKLNNIHYEDLINSILSILLEILNQSINFSKENNSITDKETFLRFYHQHIEKYLKMLDSLETSKDKSINSDYIDIIINNLASTFDNPKRGYIALKYFFFLLCLISFGISIAFILI